jgi:hypothetical protein
MSCVSSAPESTVICTHQPDNNKTHGVTVRLLELIIEVCVPCQEADVSSLQPGASCAASTSTRRSTQSLISLPSMMSLSCSTSALPVRAIPISAGGEESTGYQSSLRFPYVSTFPPGPLYPPTPVASRSAGVRLLGQCPPQHRMKDEGGSCSQCAASRLPAGGGTCAPLTRSSDAAITRLTLTEAKTFVSAVSRPS